MRKIIYGLTLAVAVTFSVHDDAIADEVSPTLSDLEPYNVAFYFASSRYKSTNVASYGDFYRSRHKYNDGHQNNREARRPSPRRASNTQRKPIPPVVQPPSSIETNGHPTFIFNPNELNWGAYDENGNLINYGRASGGRDYCADINRPCKTPSGSFSVYRKGGPDCKSSKYPIGVGGAPMGWCMFFRGGYAIHASNDVPQHNASHGCIRVQPHAAKWLSNQFMKIGTKVIIHGY